MKRIIIAIVVVLVAVVTQLENIVNIFKLLFRLVGLENTQF